MQRVPSREELITMHCKNLPPVLEKIEIHSFLSLLPEWKEENGSIERTYTFTDYHATLAFIQEIAPVIHLEDHHPELIVNYSTCTVRFQTHATLTGHPGITENDFICAAKIEDIYGK